MWTPRPPRIVRGHPGFLADLCWSRAPVRLPWMVPEFAYPAHTLRYLRLRDVVLFPPQSVVMPRPGLVSAETQQDWREPFTRLPGLEGAGTDRPRLRVAAARPRREVPGLHLSVCHVHAPTYGHWMCDALAGLVDMIAPVRRGAVRLLAPPLAPWQRRTLDLLGVPAGAIDVVDEPSVRCADLVWHSYATTIHTHQPTELVRDVYARLARAARPDAGGDRPRLVHVSRAALGAGSRLCLNEAALAAALGRLGFVSVAPERMTVDEQIAVFSRAAAVVGLHGSGLANIGFAPPGCLVVDIMSSRTLVGWIFRLTRQLGQHYAYVIGDDAPPDPAGRPVLVFTVDVARTVAIVRAGMERLGIPPGP